MAEHIRSLPTGVPLIVTGDFNAPSGSEVQQVFSGLLQDAWETAVQRSGPDATLNFFRGATDSGRIDWILYRGSFRVLEAETVVRNENGRYPSDHYPVFAVLELH